VKITIVEVKGNHVKLGIDAPPSVKVHREEIYERIQQENRRAQALRDGVTDSSAPGLGERSAPSPPRASIPENGGGRAVTPPRKPDEEGQP